MKKLVYSDALEKIQSFTPFGINPGTERICKLLSMLNNPQEKLKVVHVAGTNGKGSVCTMLASILKEAGYKVGLFVSPHVVDFRERMQINNRIILKKELCNIFIRMYPLAMKMREQGEYITEFELVTAIAFVWFKEQNCDIVILETGLGGRLDATNVISDPLVSVITSISLDHTDILGGNLVEIATEKAGIIKKNGNTVLTYNQNDDVKEVIKNTALKSDNILTVSKPCEYKGIEKGFFFRSRVSYENEDYLLNLLGKHQAENFSVVISTINILNKKGFRITQNDIKKGVKKTEHPARLEILSTTPLILLDGAHNPAGAESLASFIKEHLGSKKLVGIMGILNDKDYRAFFKTLVPFFDTVILTSVNSPRALHPGKAADGLNTMCSNIIVEEDVKKALDIALKNIKSDEAIIICGSLYLAGEIRDLVLNMTQKPESD